MFGLLTVAIRVFSSWSEGVTFAILWLICSDRFSIPL
ncbi:MAG: hypothetical protein ACOXZ4_07955 [Sphaerochaetaceae bacterium]